MMAMTGCTVFPSAKSDIERISAQRTSEMLGQPDVIVVDVRSGRDWEKSKSKIKGARREDLSKIADWMDAYPKDKTLIFYCA